MTALEQEEKLKPLFTDYFVLNLYYNSLQIEKLE